MLETFLNIPIPPPKGEFEIDIDPSRQSVGDLLLTDFGNRRVVFEVNKKNATVSPETGVVIYNGEKYYNPNGEIGLVELGTKKMGFFDASSEITFEFITRATDPKTVKMVFSTGNYPSTVVMQPGCNITIDRATGSTTSFFNAVNTATHYSLVINPDLRVTDTLRRYKIFYNAVSGMVKYRNDITGIETDWRSVGNRTESYFRLFSSHDNPNGGYGAAFLFKRLTMKYTDV